MLDQQLTDFASQEPISLEPPKRSKKILLAVIFIIGGVLIIGGGAFAYLNYFQYYFTPPEKIIQIMTSRLIEVKSLEYSGEIKAETVATDITGAIISPPKSEQSQLDKYTINSLVNFTGKSDISNIENPKGLLTLTIKTDALQVQEFGFSLEVRFVDKVLYVKLIDLPPIADSFGFDLSSIKNQWIKIDIEAAKELRGAVTFEEQPGAGKGNQKLSSEQFEKIKNAIRQARIIKITDTLASEKIEGINTFHYKFTFDREGIKKLVNEISQIIQNRALTEKELADFDKSLETVELPEGDLWIGKKDLLPRKISLSSTIKEPGTSKTYGTVNFTLMLKNFNEPVQVDVPSPTKPLEEIFGAFFGGLGGTTPDTDQDGLSDDLEKVHGTDPKKPDTDGDGFRDGEEVKNGYNPNGPGKLQ